MKMKTLVLGIGNELYGDDAVGIHVIRYLKKELGDKKQASAWLKHADFEECSLSGLSLLDVVVGYDKLIIVDAIKKPDPHTGRIHLLEKKDLKYIPGPSPHYVSVPQALEIGEKLGLKMPKEIRIVAVEAKNMYNLGETLTPEMKAALPSIVRKVKRVLREG
jgi:hydrogenase maturation protease